ncbi:hypothetical protein BD324DRAFT_259470 [Kockovaella imperatae]|uniref:BHLH domain-containing protein n=1 Tax=Kockovaella imperatae TaxID=4999 RepID=A0A1Y1UQ42_9TREE|nr:hypothetical protein BD324DRAFT_259470 [Kockovaella imperatae]ORX40119.1 hypothetical protein BD324DRAFT_259470 [Kockovaella imperatae]
MSSCVNSASPPPPNLTSAIQTTHLLYTTSPSPSYLPLEDIIDYSSFPFLDNVQDELSMDHLFSQVPQQGENRSSHNLPPPPHEPITSTRNSQVPYQGGQSPTESKADDQDVPMGVVEAREQTYPSALPIPIGGNLPLPPPPSVPYDLGPYANMYGYTPMVVSETSHPQPMMFHPYRFDGYRSPPRWANSPEHHSPQSISPPGSSHSPMNHPALSQSGSPIQAGSPPLVSPTSGLGSMSDVSPGSAVWAYNLPQAAGSVGSLGGYVNTPLTSISALPNMPSGSPPGSTTGSITRMFAGMPYYSAATGATPPKSALLLSGAHPARPKVHKKSGSTSRRDKEFSKSVSKPEIDSDVGGDEVEQDDQIPPIGKSIFTPEDLRSPNLTEEVRKARIKSEQRRRDELRDGFTRLREALPASNQRPSKSSILDRAVAHIQQVESANHYLMNQLDEATKDTKKLQESNAELVRALAASTQTRAPSSPGSSAPR